MLEASWQLLGNNTLVEKKSHAGHTHTLVLVQTCHQMCLQEVNKCIDRCSATGHGHEHYLKGRGQKRGAVVVVIFLVKAHLDKSAWLKYNR